MTSPDLPAIEARLAAIRQWCEAKREQGIEAHLGIVGDMEFLLGQIDRSHSWDGLMSLLDEHWPTDIFPMGDTPEADGDPGPRIVSLLRWVNQLRAELARKPTGVLHIDPPSPRIVPVAVPCRRCGFRGA